MCAIRISLFGKFCIEADQTKVHSFETRKAEELLNYLLLYRDRPHARESLAEVLWAGTAPEQSKGYLRKALWLLQSALETVGGQDLITVEGDWLQINSSSNYWLDVAKFEAVYTRVQGVRGRDLSESVANDIQTAVTIYRGELLDGWYQDWCLFERERFNHQYLAMLDKLMDFCEARQLYEDGLSHGEKILRYDRARERTHRKLMRLLYLAGDRTGALRQYEKCLAALKEELSVDPSERTLQLYELIRADYKLDDQSLNLNGNPRYNPLHAALVMLVTFQNALGKMQLRLEQDIQEIHRVISSMKE